MIARGPALKLRMRVHACCACAMLRALKPPYARQHPQPLTWFNSCEKEDRAKKMRVEERSEWTKKDGHGHTYGSDDEESGEVGSNQSKGVTRACSACGSSTHKRPTHRDCPFNTAAVEGIESIEAAAPSSASESDFGVELSIGGLCTCGSSCRAHKREYPLILRWRFPASSVPPSTRTSPSSICVPMEEKEPSPTRRSRWCPQEIYGLLSPLLSHCWGGQWPLCIQGVWTTSFCAAELTPLAGGPVLSQEILARAPMAP